jgi:hypothetical protein
VKAEVVDCGGSDSNMEIEISPADFVCLILRSREVPWKENPRKQTLSDQFTAPNPNHQYPDTD